MEGRVEFATAGVVPQSAARRLAAEGKTAEVKGRQNLKPAARDWKEMMA
jgi:hypothetical protein